MVAASSSLLHFSSGLGRPGFESVAYSGSAMVDYTKRLGYSKEMNIRMTKSLRFLLLTILGAVLLLVFSSDLINRVAVYSIVNQALVPAFLVYGEQLLAGPGHSGPTAGIFNQTTLLSYAAIELGEAEQRQLISRLLNYSVDSIKFHQVLGAWVQNKRFDPRVMTELGDLVKTPLDRHYNDTRSLEIRPGQAYRSCAVVGNSGILLQKTQGQLIDSHEMVIRLNNAHTRGFEKKVGSKTTLAFINSNILHGCARRVGCFCHSYGEGVPIMIYICQPAQFMDFVRCNASHKAPLLVTDARFDNLCSRLVKYYSLKIFVETTGKHPDKWSEAHEGPMFHYSSGMQAVMVALGICEKVSLFGFGKSAEAKHHYHTYQRSELTLHDYEAEYRLYRDLADRSPDIPFLSDAGIELPPVEIYL